MTELRFAEPRQVVLLGLGMTAVALAGYLVGSAGSVVLGGLVAAGFSVLLFFRPVLGLLLLAATIPLENLLVLGGATLPKLLGVATVGAWIANKIVTRSSFRDLVMSRFFAASVGFVGLAWLSVLWAHVPDEAISGTIRLVQMVVLGLLIVDLIPTSERADALVKVLFVGTSIAAFMTIEQYIAGGYRRAGEQIAGGVNATAVLLVSMMPFAFYLYRSSGSLIWRVLAVAYFAAGSLAVVMTFSRMNMLLLPPLLAALLWHAFQHGRGRGWLAVLLVLCVTVAIPLTPWNRVAQRVGTIVPYISSTIDPAAEGASSGRGYHMRIGLAIARDNPVLGAGYNNYGDLFRETYQFTVPGADRLYSSARSPHSSYVGIIADLGLVGISLWLYLLVGVGLANSLGAWRLSRGDPESPVFLLSQAVTYAIGLHVLAYGFYQPNQEEKILWAFLALSVIVHRLAVQNHRRYAYD